MDASIAKANAQLDKLLRPLFQNTVFLVVIGLFFAIYAGFLAPALPNRVILFFDTIPGKLLFIFLIAFVASRNVENSFQVALIVSIMFLITLTVLNNLKMKEAFQNLGVEHFSLMNQMRDLVEHMDPALAGQTEMKGKCDKAMNWCATQGTPEVRGRLWSEQPLSADKPVDLPADEKYAQESCGGYYMKCAAEMPDFKFTPSMEGATISKEKCMSAYGMKEPSEETCKGIYTKEKCMDVYDIQPANEENCAQFLKVQNEQPEQPKKAN